MINTDDIADRIGDIIDEELPGIENHYYLIIDA